MRTKMGDCEHSRNDHFRSPAVRGRNTTQQFCDIANVATIRAGDIRRDTPRRSSLINLGEDKNADDARKDNMFTSALASSLVSFSATQDSSRMPDASACYPFATRPDFGVAVYVNNHDEIGITCILECEMS